MSETFDAIDIPAWIEGFSETAQQLGYSAMDPEWLEYWIGAAIKAGYAAGRESNGE
jgi:hypothetical protein